MFVALSGWVASFRKYRTFSNFFGRTAGADISSDRQNFLAFHGTRRIVCVFNRLSHFSLPWARWIHCATPQSFIQDPF